MKLGLRSGAALVVLAMMAVPLVPAQIDNPDDPTPTTLYFHIWDPFNKFVINTQPYDADFFDVGGVNFPTVSAAGEEFNTMYGYSTAGPVEYEFIEAGRPRLHPERGIAADVQIDGNSQPVVYMYVDARGIWGGDDTPATLPQMTFRATMREGDNPGDSSELDSGELIMEGASTVSLFDGRVCPWHTVVGPTLINGGYLGLCDTVRFDVNDATGYDQFPQSDPVTGNPIVYPDENNIHEIRIPMEVSQDSIPQAESYNIRLDYFQEFGGPCGEDECAQGNLRYVLDQEHLPRLEMNVTNPVYISFIHPQVAAGTLLIHTGVNSPWGTYDVDADNITVSIDGPSEPQFLQEVVAANKHVHGLHHLDAEITYLWKFRDEGAAEGDYTITMTVPNLAGNAEAVGTAGFTIEGKKAFGISDTGEVVPETTLDTDSANGTPGAGALGVLAALGAVAVALRRWRP